MSCMDCVSIELEVSWNCSEVRDNVIIGSSSTPKFTSRTSVYNVHLHITLCHTPYDLVIQDYIRRNFGMSIILTEGRVIPKACQQELTNGTKRHLRYRTRKAFGLISISVHDSTESASACIF